MDVSRRHRSHISQKSRYERSKLLQRRLGHRDEALANEFIGVVLGESMPPEGVLGGLSFMACLYLHQEAKVINLAPAVVLIPEDQTSNTKVGDVLEFSMFHAQNPGKIIVLHYRVLAQLDGLFQLGFERFTENKKSWKDE